MDAKPTDITTWDREPQRRGMPPRTHNVRRHEQCRAPFNSGGATAKQTDAPKAGYKPATHCEPTHARTSATCDRPT